VALYTDPASVRVALAGSLTDYSATGTAASLSDTELNDAIREAQGVVDGYLSTRYETPITNGADNALLWGMTRDIAAYLATLTYRKNKDLTATDPVALRYQAAMAQLQALQQGVMALDFTPDAPLDGEPDLSGMPIVENAYEGTLFNRPLVPEWPTGGRYEGWGFYRAW